MKVTKGDLIQLARYGCFDVIVHGCNCFCTMGEGIAKQIKTFFPEALKADKATPVGAKIKLGSYSSAKITTGKHTLIIVNAYTQFDFAGSDVLVEYNALSEVFSRIRKDFSGLRIAYPKIGAGLAGGDWDKISRIIDKELEGEDHTLVEYVPLQKREQGLEKKLPVC